MTYKFSKYVKANLTHDQETYIIQGSRKAKELATNVEEALGVASHMLVRAKNQTIIYGPPGVGKTYTTRQTCVKHGIQPIQINSGATPSFIATKFAYAEYWTPPGQEIAVIWDDADDVVFGDKKDANRWKMVFQDEPSEAFFNHEKNLTNEVLKFEKNGEERKAEAMKAFMKEDSIGINIPLARFKHIFLTNHDYELMSEKPKTAWMGPIVDRFKPVSLSYDWTTAWGWLSLVLLESQPYKETFGIELDEKQKIAIIRWLYERWDKLKRQPSYRTVKEMAENIINEPANYLNRWERLMK